MKHTGITHVGIGSSEAPDSTSNLPQSLYPIGISHVGLFTGLIGHNKGFQCKAKVRGFYRGCFALHGIPSFLRSKAYPMHGTVYTDVTSQYIEAKGICVAHRIFRYKAVSSMQTKISKHYKVSSLAILKSKDRIVLQGLIKGINDILYRTSGVIKSIEKLRYRAKAKLIPVVMTMYTATANTKAWEYIGYCVHGLPAKGLRGVYVISSTVQRKLGQAYKLTGNLLNTVGQWLYNVKAKTNIASFITSVPKRVQEFVTNKRWFQ